MESQAKRVSRSICIGVGATVAAGVIFCVAMSAIAGALPTLSLSTVSLPRGLRLLLILAGLYAAAFFAASRLRERMPPPPPPGPLTQKQMTNAVYWGTMWAMKPGTVLLAGFIVFVLPFLLLAKFLDDHPWIVAFIIFSLAFYSILLRVNRQKPKPIASPK